MFLPSDILCVNILKLANEGYVNSGVLKFHLNFCVSWLLTGIRGENSSFPQQANCYTSIKWVYILRKDTLHGKWGWKAKTDYEMQ